jgi:hypothetical protein
MAWNGKVNLWKTVSCEVTLEGCFNKKIKPQRDSQFSCLSAPSQLIFASEIRNPDTRSI